MPTSTILAQIIYKKLVKRNRNDFKFKKTTIEGTYKYSIKLKPPKSRGDDELNISIVKQIPNLMALCITHLCNHKVRKGIFPEIIKTSIVILLKKPRKPKDSLNAFRPINNIY